MIRASMLVLILFFLPGYVSQPALGGMTFVGPQNYSGNASVITGATVSLIYGFTQGPSAGDLSTLGNAFLQPSPSPPGRPSTAL